MPAVLFDTRQNGLGPERAVCSRAAIFRRHPRRLPALRRGFVPHQALVGKHAWRKDVSSIQLGSLASRSSDEDAFPTVPRRRDDGYPIPANRRTGYEKLWSVADDHCYRNIRHLFARRPAKVVEGFREKRRDWQNSTQTGALRRNFRDKQVAAKTLPRGCGGMWRGTPFPGDQIMSAGESATRAEYHDIRSVIGAKFNGRNLWLWHSRSTRYASSPRTRLGLIVLVRAALVGLGDMMTTSGRRDAVPKNLVLLNCDIECSTLDEQDQAAALSGNCEGPGLSHGRPGLEALFTGGSALSAVPFGS
jgi:hypothetical protein